jgi:hypothetical protein
MTILTRSVKPSSSCTKSTSLSLITVRFLTIRYRFLPVAYRFSPKRFRSSNSGVSRKIDAMRG